MPIIEKTLGSKARKMVYSRGRRAPAPEWWTPRTPNARAFVLDDAEILALARWAVHRSRTTTAGPMDMEWAKDGETGELFMVQARPETVQSRKTGPRFTLHHLLEQGPVLVTRAGDRRCHRARARPASSGARRTSTSFRDGAILVTEMTDPDWVPIMKRAAGIVTDHGGRTCHAAIVSRELGVPAVVGTGNATERPARRPGRDGLLRRGRRGPRLRGPRSPSRREEVDLGELPATRTTDHGQHRQPRRGVPAGGGCRPTASGSPGWSSSSAT